jgi:hypothetical protein
MPADGARRREPHDTPRAACDFCGVPRAQGERRRFVWDTELGDELVLADLCGRCATEAPRLLEVYGGHGREVIRLTQAATVSAVAPGPVRRVGGIFVRGLLYVLIALAAFVVVTFVTSRV